MPHLTDTLVRKTPAPSHGQVIIKDDEIRGFGVRVTAGGARSFVLGYSVNARERRFTLGAFPVLTTAMAREKARKLRQQILDGIDPMAERQAEREAPTVDELCARYDEDYLPRKRPSSVQQDRSRMRRHIRPALGARKVKDIDFADADRLFRAVTKGHGPIEANRMHALASTMFNLAIKWGWRSDNPFRYVNKNLEQPRTTYIEGEQLQRLFAALAEHPQKQAANVIRLMLLTGSRKHEVLTARREDVDLERAVWTRPSRHMKTKRTHVLPLSAAARLVFAEQLAASSSEWLFPRPNGRAGHVTSLEYAWTAICKAAGISGLRMHDLRHTHASVLANSGVSLGLVGQLLGHTKATTTARYSHFYDDTQRAAVEAVAAVLEGGRQSGEAAAVISLAKRRR
jgi:integrase